MTLRRTIVVGDVQGCLVELVQLAEELKYDQHKDRLILAGDLLDRGPHSAGVVAWAMLYGAEAIMGNHEESHLRFRKHEQRAVAEPGYKNPMRERPPGEAHRVVYESLSKDQWKWLETRPKYIHIDDHWTVVHAGCSPGKPIEELRRDYQHRYRKHAKMYNFGSDYLGFGFR